MAEVTARDFFAGMALVGLIAQPLPPGALHGVHWEEEKTSRLTEEAYRFADAMVKLKAKRRNDH